MCKADLVSLFIIRLLMSLSIIAYLSPENSAGTEEESSTV